MKFGGTLGRSKFCAFEELYPIQRIMSDDCFFFCVSLKSPLVLFTSCCGVDPKWP